MSDQIVLRVVAKMLIPFIILFGLYVITHGEVGPGGGFQGGVIVAVAFILYGLIYGRDALERLLPHRLCDALAAGGVLMYSGVGIACVFAGGYFLDFRALLPGWPALGLSLVEYGVGLTVASVMITIYNKMTEPVDDDAEAGA